MRIPGILLVCATLLTLGSCAGTGSAPHVVQATMQGQSMQQMLADINDIRGYVYGGPQADADKAAADLVARSQRLTELFPPGTASADYVDMSPARVRDAPAAMQQTSQALLAAVRSGSRPATGDLLAQTERDGCGFCHRSGTR